ncbi:6-methylsalicylic acid synthase [Micromonospora echinofusca]|uniref:6-methylsalicylic acid synthase n=1 Tax=Micromonospora echinofusca TaxID=47858 RepID=A0A1C5GHJ9_MICEH|nr:type I polyketide synthase [Micromonospora echinofusca]SCG19052.1 6-methylsalicylic acid synthase [Micromonospora echinofusca]
MRQDREISDAVAIVGMSCRFAPDLDSPEKFWEFLAGGHSAVSEMPDKRWEPYASTSPQATAIMRRTTRLGSFLKDIEGFDADFFGISPREADFLDPQQRIVLELSWEALADAGIPPMSLRGSDAGVFVAANSNDYGRRLLEDIPRTGAYAVNGTTYYGIANRVSYFLDLRGPSLAVDTACAGSLTALHMACQSLREGETPVAIVGGINIMATPALFVALDAAGATAPDGRSKAFDKDADGYGRGEGAGVVVLKRLVDALSDGDRVLAVIRGSGVFQDGRSDGMMAPNGTAQEHMLRLTYARAGIAPETVDYVEAHGTGTPVGDREEAQALAAVFGADRPADDPCLIGSVKPNIGHVEAGSGIAGVIKTVLALRHEEIPPSLHREPNPDFDWVGSGLRLVGAPKPWPTGGEPRRAGVSSYGVGGSISHIIVEEAPAVTAEPTDASEGAGLQRELAVFPVSAMSEAGLAGMAARTADWLEANPTVALASVGHTLSQRRSHLAQRAAVVAGSTRELAERLRALADGQRSPGVVTARVAAGESSPVVWVFSGHGSQWPGMGQQLLRDEPVFAETIDALADVFRDEIGWTPREALASGGPWSSYEVQALTFATQVGLAEVWRRHGVTPGAVIGHSVGEIAAAVVAGSLDMIEAARFACRRATALRRLQGQGGMALVGLSFADAQARLAGRTEVVAAISASPESTVVSGDREVVERLAEEWRGEGLGVWRVDTDIAFHSPHVDAIVAEVADAARELTVRPARVDLYSTAMTDPRSTAARDSDYWAANLRQPVRFAEAVEAALADGHRLFLEISSHPVVTHSIREGLERAGVEEAIVIHSLRRETNETETLLGSLAELHCHGAAVDWSREHPAGGLVDLPAMAWQHRPYWIFPEAHADAGPGGGHDPDKHSLLGGRMTVSGAPPRQVWQTHLDMDSRPYPLDHEVVDVEITPAAVIINSFALAAEQGGRLPGLADIVLRTPLAVAPPRIVQIVLSENTARLATRIAGQGDSASEDEEYEWITHSTATIDWSTDLVEGRVDGGAVKARCPEEWSWQRVDDMFRRMGVGGYAFPWDVHELRRNGTEQLAEITIVPPPAERATSWAHVIDGALTISAVLVTPEYARHQWMSSHIDSVVFRGDPPAKITVHSVRSPRSPEDTVDVSVADETGRVVCQVRGLRFSAISDEDSSVAAPRELVHEMVWRPMELTDDSIAQELTRLAVVGAGAGADGLAARLIGAGLDTRQVATPDDLALLPVSELDAVLVVPAAGQPDEAPEEAAERCGWTLIRSAQALIEAKAASGDPSAPLPRLWPVTQGVRDAAAESALAHGPMWGIARIIAGEQPDMWGGVLDVDAVDGDTVEKIMQVLRQLGGSEDVISVRADGVSVARLSQIERPSDGAALQCRPTDTYLITGGLGVLGLMVARWLADRGARRILLAGRRGLPPRAEWGREQDNQTRRQIEGVLELEALGVTVRALALDITDADEVAAALDPASHGMPPVRGIVHAAGVVRDAMVDKVDREGLRDVLGPKVHGAMVLHRLFPPGSLDFFVMFSSCGQFTRLTGQTTYAAANSFLDALAAHRHASGHHETTSLGWTSWRGVGMSQSISTTMMEANSRGLDAVSVTEAFRAWAFADRFDTPYQAILRVLPTPPNAPRMPMLRELTATRSETGDDEAQGPVVDWSLPEEELRAQVTADVREQAAAELNLAPADLELRRPLVELGVDSVMTVALRVRLQRRYGLDLPPNILWNKPTITALAEHIIDALRPVADAEPVPAGAAGAPAA